MPVIKGSIYHSVFKERKLLLLFQVLVSTCQITINMMLQIL